MRHLARIFNRTLALATTLVLAPLLMAGAQGPVAEGTVLTVSTTVTWTDVNSNTYTPATASASVTVGFLAGVDITGAAEVNPASPSTGNEMTLTLTNTGNGVDTLLITGNGGLDQGYTVTGITVNGAPYTSETVGTGLATVSVPAGGTVTLVVTYDVPPGEGGALRYLTLSIGSKRDPSATDDHTIDIHPPLIRDIEVTSSTPTADRVPSNGGSYTATFEIENPGSGADSYTLTAGVSSGTMTIVSVNGTPGSSSTVAVGVGGSESIDVVYTIADVAGGSTVTLTLTATSTNDGAATDAATHLVTVVRADVSASVVIHGETDGTRDATPLDPETDIPPGGYFWYRVTVTNDGEVAASDISASQILPSGTTYISNEGDGGSPAWSISHSSGTVTATLADPLPAAASRHFWIRVQVQ